MSPDICPNCGAEIPRDAKACSECGADEKTGWSEDAHTGGLDLPEENFDYEEFVKREFTGEKNFIPRGIHWFWWAIGIVILSALLWVWLF